MSVLVCIITELNAALPPQYFLIFVASRSGNGILGIGIVSKTRVPLSHSNIWSEPHCISEA